ncbi:GNAT family N-acetyltransferase [Alkalicoccus daliensis]|uniref:Ribosomal-protein-alanine N-acetyltransferase n=1 Tax=Alkalicoccus daliensis TaxID=745820 RepID=A0A1H0D0N5_9BACI|nr:GNAT family N-acetyltransferase [Alkalicoccus daliensis]SDN63724.1 ribosomal-protein-alanine N-acetyltransferase [Alkalicoccus daliensis]
MKMEDFLMNLPSFETPRLILRKVELSDLDDIYAFSSDPEVAHHMTWSVNQSKEETYRNYVEPVLRDYQTGESGDWVIVHMEDEKVIGACSFVKWENSHEKAEIGFVLHKDYWGQGIATEAVREIVRFGFETCRLHRIEGKCNSDNIGSEKVLRKAGFTYEGTLRENELIKGKFCDTKMFSMLKNEFI